MKTKKTEPINIEKLEEKYASIKVEIDLLQKKGLITEEEKQITLCVIRHKFGLPYIPIFFVSKSVDINQFLRDVYGRRNK